MKAAVVTEQGVQYTDAPKPSPKANEILIKVKAASLNRADLAVASGHRHGTVGGAGTIVGLECAGEVEAVGADVKDFRPGDRVMSSAAGGFAEYAVADAGRAHKIPANNMSYEQAACMPVAVQTMHNALVGAGRLKKGESVLIQGASSGVGLLGMQIARHMGASIVMGSSTNEGRRGKLKDFGCDVAIDTTDPKWPEKVKEATGGKGVDLIVDQVSGGVANQNMEAAAILGRIVNVGRLAGMQSQSNFDLHALKRTHYLGVPFRPRTPDEVRAIVASARADLWPAIESGTLHLPIDRTFPLSQAAEALAHMKANAHFGKIVLVV